MYTPHFSKTDDSTTANEYMKPMSSLKLYAPDLTCRRCRPFWRRSSSSAGRAPHTHRRPAHNGDNVTLAQGKLRHVPILRGRVRQWSQVKARARLPIAMTTGNGHTVTKASNTQPVWKRMAAVKSCKLRVVDGVYPTGRGGRILQSPLCKIRTVYA
jgi:hypothetical protein